MRFLSCLPFWCNCLCVYVHVRAQEQPAAVVIGCFTSWPALGSLMLIWEWDSRTCAHVSQEARLASGVAVLWQAHLCHALGMCPPLLVAHALC